MKDFKFIPYNKNLIPRARELRREATEAEKLFWEKILKNKKLEDLKFTRQKPLGHFIVDFYCSHLGIAIEIDGEVHIAQQARDKERDNILEQKFGLRVIRYKNEEVLKNTEKVVENLVGKLKR
ncbi:MAG: DUF559 domain-containing protein [Nanoarchaeota archaeon]